MGSYHQARIGNQEQWQQPGLFGEGGASGIPQTNILREVIPHKQADILREYLPGMLNSYSNGTCANSKFMLPACHISLSA